MLDPAVLIYLLPLVVLFHTLLIFVGMRHNVLLMLVIAFMLVERFSRAEDLSFLFAMKYVRVYLTGLTLLVGVLLYRYVKFGPAGLALLIFATFFWMSALWSDYMMAGLFHKGLYWVLVFNGLMLSMAVYNVDSARSVSRVLFVGVSFFPLVVLALMASSPSMVLEVGRLSVLGMNANGLGSAGAMAVPFCLYIWFFDKKKMLRVAALVVLVVSCVIIVYSGSRGALAQGVASALILVVPRFRRPGTILFFALLLAVPAWLLMGVVENSAGAERLQEFNFDTREQIWSYAWELFAEKPVVGHGWISELTPDGRQSTFTLQSTYLQILCESGIVGLLLLLSVLLYIASRGVRLYRRVVATYETSLLGLWYLSFAIMIPILARCVVETGPFTGTQSQALFLPFSIGLIDSICRCCENSGRMRWGITGRQGQGLPQVQGS